MNKYKKYQPAINFTLLMLGLLILLGGIGWLRFNLIPNWNEQKAIIMSQENENAREIERQKQMLQWEKEREKAEIKEMSIINSSATVSAEQSQISTKSATTSANRI